VEVYKVKLEKEGQPISYFKGKIYQNKGAAKTLVTKINKGDYPYRWYLNAGYKASLVTYILTEVENGE
jgi:hypothetical protein